jgi:hypothetical protein
MRCEDAKSVFQGSGSVSIASRYTTSGERPVVSKLMEHISPYELEVSSLSNFMNDTCFGGVYK